MKPKLTNLTTENCLLLYIIIAVLTFGIAWNRNYRLDDGDYNGFCSLLCGVAWPFYWSVEATKFLRHSDQKIERPTP